MHLKRVDVQHLNICDSLGPVKKRPIRAPSAATTTASTERQTLSPTLGGSPCLLQMSGASSEATTAIARSNESINSPVRCGLRTATLLDCVNSCERLRAAASGDSMKIDCAGGEPALRGVLQERRVCETSWIVSPPIPRAAYPESYSGRRNTPMITTRRSSNSTVLFTIRS